MIRKLFGTDGIRGTANKYPMNCDMALVIGKAAARLFKKSRDKNDKIIIGRDTRTSGSMLENALTSGICSEGVDVIIKRKKDINSIPEIKDKILKSEKELSGTGQVLVRFSGTEQLCRVMVEAATDEMAQKIAKRLADAVERNLC